MEQGLEGGWGFHFCFLVFPVFVARIGYGGELK
jgi:hypothetical protein